PFNPPLWHSFLPACLSPKKYYIRYQIIIASQPAKHCRVASCSDRLKTRKPEGEEKVAGMAGWLAGFSLPTSSQPTNQPNRTAPSLLLLLQRRLAGPSFSGSSSRLCLRF